ncbi:hypothetical protein NEDG_00940 [Nematocida displodere]|uniref:DUF5096 domain-containing protein n=1 Tax=Nematocida displodere TaxID=1805483 RepID=A0A177EBB8_9MICR|nr:hypothetical protein NEDG_00940 [Nematocida displodere]
MEEYIGASLIIKTSTLKVIGVLHQIHPETHKMIIDVSGVKKAIDIREIDEVEILPEEDTTSPRVTASADLSNPKKKQSEGRVERMPLPAKGKVVDYVSHETYQQILHLSDTFYGPSIDEIVYSGARGVLHLFVNIFKVMDKKFVIYTGSGVFSEIAVVLARLCLIYNSNVSLIPTAETSRLSKELFYYRNNGGAVETVRTDQTVVIIADVECTEEMVRGSERIVFLGDYQNTPLPNKEVVFFGVPTSDPSMFTGSPILCDIGLSPQIYSKFQLKRYAPKLLQKLTKDPARGVSTREC